MSDREYGCATCGGELKRIYGRNEWLVCLACGRKVYFEEYQQLERGERERLIENMRKCFAQSSENEDTVLVN